MEMRSLTRSLRLRPAIYTKQPSTLLRGQFLTGAQSLRYSSSDNGPSQGIPLNEQSQSPSQPSSSTPSSASPSPSTTPSHSTPKTFQPRPSANPANFETILDKLNFGRRNKSPTNTTASTTDAASVSRAVGSAAQTDNYRQPVRRVELKLGPSLGRQVHVEPEKGYDLAAALRALNAACSQNKILQTQRRQKFHIRRGQMRKNLRMERWRKLFKFSFDHTVAKIQRMRAQGW